MLYKILFMPILILFGSQSIAESITLNSYYEHIDSVNPEDGLPSKCDCDYKKIGLSLNKDFSFRLSRQKGRLEILSLDIQQGKWQITSPNTLLLKIDSSFQKLNCCPNNPVKEKFNPPQKISLEIKDKQIISAYGEIMRPEGKAFKAKLPIYEMD